MSQPLGVSEKEAFAPAGVLDPEYHRPLWSDLDRICARAGLHGSSRRHVWESCLPHLDQEEVDRGASIRERLRDGEAGVIYTQGVENVPARFMSLTGSFLRNYLDARVLTLQQALDEYKRGGTVTATVLLIPDFHVPMAGADSTEARKASWMQRNGQHTGRGGGSGGAKPQWVSELVGSILLERLTAGQYTYLYSDDPERLGDDYGAYVRKLLLEHYVVKTRSGPMARAA